MVARSVRIPLCLMVGVFMLFLNTQSFLTAQTGIGDPLFQTCDSLVQAFRLKWGIPGVTVALAKDGKLVYMRGFGFADQSGAEVLQPYHMFRLASVSKPITSIAIMKLMEGGLLTLNDHVFGPGGILNADPYIAGATVSDTRIYDITVRNCLEHTTGWNREVPMVPNPPPPYTSPVGLSDPKEFPLYVTATLGEANPVTPRAMVKFLLQRGLDYTPGTQWHYGNSEYGILTLVVEQLTGMSYEDYVRSVIMEPIGIYDMHIGKSLKADKIEREGEYNAADGTILSSYGTGQLVPYHYGGLNIESATGFAGWIASARDLVRLIVAVDRFPTKPDILLPATIDTMTTPGALNSTSAKGWFIDAPGTWEHDGDYPGHQSFVLRTGSGFVWAIIVNRRDYNTHASQTNDMVALSHNCINAATSLPTYDLLDFPIQNAGNISNSNIKAQSVTVNWTNGSGTGRLLLASANVPTSKFPLDGVSYTANSAFGSGQNLGSGNYVVHSGSGTSVTVSNLFPGKVYHFRLFEFNQNDTTGNYALYQLGKSERDSIQTPLADSVGVVADADTSLCGQTVNFTATVALLPTAVGTPTGSVIFKSGATTIGTVPVDGTGHAVLTVPISSVGNQSITARYGGDGNFNADTSSILVHTVTQASTSTGLSSNVDTSYYGQKVTLTATITAMPPAGGTAGGTVTFKEDTVTLGTGSLNDSAQATYSTIGLAVGHHTFTAIYDGSSNYAGSASGSFDQEVTDFHLTVLPGWNMISYPYTSGDYSRSALFPSATSSAFAYEGAYVVVPDIVPGKGVWLNFGYPESVMLTGGLASVDSITVRQGWNMFGSISTGVGVGQVMSVPSGIIQSAFFHFDGTHYVTASEVEPGKAYWVKVSQDGKLVLSAYSSITPGSANKHASVSDELPPPPPNGYEPNPGSVLPAQFQLEQNYPNPFNPATEFRYALPVEGHVVLKIMNLLGQEVATVVDEIQAAGFKTISFDASKLPSGVYFYRLRTESFGDTKKMTILK